MRTIRLQTQIILLVCGIVIIVLTVASILVSRNIAEKVWNEQGKLAMAISHIVAASPTVIHSLESDSDNAALRQYIERIEKASGVQFIVIVDMEGIRITHPTPGRVGEHVVGGDEERSFQGETYFSVGKGTLGLSYRAFVPIFDSDRKQLGTVITGILITSVERAVEENRRIMYWAMAVGLILGTGCAIFLGRRVRKTLFGLEPAEIARITQERNAMIQSVREGVIAVDKTGTITTFNSEAKRIMRLADLPDNLMGRPITECVPHTRLMQVLASGKAEYDQEQILKDFVILTNRMPVYVDNQIVGAVATFRDMTEVRLMAEEITGVKSYVEALRAQSHEFMNKLLVILGLVRLGSYTELSTYIADIADKYQEEVASITSMIHDPIVAGFLLSKCSKASEMGVDVLLLEGSDLPPPEQAAHSHALVLILGNLIDNALEATKESPRRYVDIWMHVEDGCLHLEVGDSGTGIPDKNIKRIFEKGFSSKGEHGGFGLFLVKETVTRLEGQISVSNSDTGGALFKVSLPFKPKEARQSDKEAAQ